MNILASISGGRSSHYMAHLLKTAPEYKDANVCFAFANTGKEREETLEFVNQCDAAWGLGVVWLEALVNPEYRKRTTYKVVTFQTASRDGKPFESVIQKYGIPNAAFPHCTREMKLNPLHSFAKEYFRGSSYVTAIGIRLDEAQRIKISPDFIYPLVERAVRVAHVRRFWNESSFDLKLRDYEGNCDLCFKKSQRKLLTLLVEKPELAKWWIDIEDRYSRIVSEHRPGQINDSGTFFGRKNQPMRSLVELARLRNFVPVTDPFWKESFSDTMDFEQPCACMQMDFGGDFE